MNQFANAMAAPSTAATHDDATAPHNALYKKVAWRIMPLLLVCQLLAYLDRVNVGLAKIQMGHDLHFSEAAYGLGAGIFFLGYFLFEVPSNIMLHKVGARRWIARIMISWGILSAATMLVTGTTSFYVMRFLLGVAEAGFFPGIILYLTLWFPAVRRGRMTTLFMTATAVSGIVGGPLSGWIMTAFDGRHGWTGWQWLFLLEGLPSALVGLVVLRYLDDSIESAGWLRPEEKVLLRAALDDDARVRAGVTPRSSVLVIALSSLVYFLLLAGLYGIGFWLPSIIREAGVASPGEIGTLSAIPYLCAAVAMNLVAASADRRRAWKSHVALAAFAAAAGLIASTWWASSLVASMVALSLATAGILSALPLFWNLPTMMLRGVAAASGIAVINSMGNLSGFVSPLIVGWMAQRTHSAANGVVFLAVCVLLASVLTLLMRSAQAHPALPAV